MRKLAFASLFLFAGVAGADHKPAPAPAAAAAPAAGESKVTGEVLDLACYTDHQASGAKHASCATKCLQGGAPAGLLSDGKVYLVVGANHENASAKLAPFAGQKVTITGKTVDLPGGGHALAMSDVSAAK